MPAEEHYQLQLLRSLRPLDLVLYGIAFMSPIAGFTVFGFVRRYPRGRPGGHRLPAGDGTHIYECQLAAGRPVGGGAGSRGQAGGLRRSTGLSLDVPAE